MFTPTSFGRYFLVDRLAVGGMGEIFLARLPSVGGVEKTLVLKLILPQFAQDPDFVSMFIDEARVAALLHHGNIAQIYELGREEGRYFIAMEHVDGVTLFDLIRGGAALPPAQAAFATAAVARGLAYAHRKLGEDGTPLGIVHRDVSPENVMVSREGQVKLIDFGIARAQLQVRRTQAGVVKGKWEYMAPEQREARSEALGPATDVWALGVLLAELLGRRARQEQKPEAIAEALVGAPEGLRGIVASCTAEDPDARPDAQGVARALDREVALMESKDPAELLAARVVEALEANQSSGARSPEDEVDGAQPSRHTARAADAAVDHGSVQGEDDAAAPSESDGRITRIAADAVPESSGGGRGLMLAGFALLALLALAFFAVPRPPSVTMAGRSSVKGTTPQPSPPVAAVLAATADSPPATQETQASASASGSATRATPAPSSASAPATPAPPPQRARPTVRMGRLIVNAEPWARVFVDGELRTEQTPLDLKLRAGRHKLHLVNGADPYLWQTLEVQIPGGGELRKIVRLERRAKPAPKP